MASKIKIVYVISDMKRSVFFEAVFSALDKEQFDISLILLNSRDSTFEQYIKDLNIPVWRLPLPTKKDYWRVGRQIYLILRRLKPQIVHTHMRDADFLGLSAAWAGGVKVRIHTRHFSTNNHDYYPHAVKYDRLINRMATHIIAISDNVRQVLTEREGVPPNKVFVLYNAHDLQPFAQVDAHEINTLRQKYALFQQYPVIGCIARYTTLKGHQYLIAAFAQLLKKFPNARLMLANANGSEKQIIKAQLEQQLPKESYTEIEFEEQIHALYHLFDVFVHVPIDRYVEGFGFTYIEALAAGIPSIFTLSGVATEFIIDGHNALVVPYCSAEAIEKALYRLLSDKKLREQLSTAGKLSVAPFDIKIHAPKLMEFYKNSVLK